MSMRTLNTMKQCTMGMRDNFGLVAAVETHL